MHLKKLILLISFLLCWFYSFCQQPAVKTKITIIGKVLDSLSNKPIEFATVSFKSNNKTVGTTSDNKGKFKIEIPSGIYVIQIKYFSYSTKQFVNKNLNSDTDLGVFYLSLKTEYLNEVQIVSDKRLLEFKVNKKIYNSSRDIANKGGNAIDVLNNTPSVRVDDNGEVIMKGTVATVLIDGKPVFGLENSTDILNSMPSNSIEKVEIITRSAKYSAEGGGILNIVTKRRIGTGLSGSLDFHLGTPDNNGASSFLNENTDNIDMFSTISFNNEKKIKHTTINQAFLDANENTIGISNQFRNDENQRNSFLFSIGSDFYIDNNNTLTASLLVNTNNKNFISTLDLNDFDAASILEQSSLRNIRDLEDISKIELFFNYTTKFSEDGHQLSFDFRYDNTVSDNRVDINENISIPTADTIFQQVKKDQNLDNFLVQLDYALPLNETKKIELGYKGTLRYYDNTYKVDQFDEVLSDFVTIGGFNDILNYEEEIHAFYGQYSVSHGNFSYSAGLRTETSKISIGKNTGNNTITKNYTDFFPSTTISYEFENSDYLSLDYHRGIYRPVISQLNPFISFNNARFQSIGNPDLNPYYNNYLELSYSKSLEKLVMISSFYLNYANDHFLSILQNTGQNADGLDTFSRTTINSGDENILGIDLSLIYRPFKGLRLNGYVTPYRDEITNAIDASYNNSNVVWYAQGSALISLNNGIKFNLSHNYQSAIKTGLTDQHAVNFSNISISKSLFKKKANLTFKILDIFSSKILDAQSFESNANTLRNLRYDHQFNLSFTYQFRQKRKSAKDRSNEIKNEALEDKQDEKF